MITKAKQLTHNKSKFKTIKILSKDSLERIMKSADLQKSQYCLKENNKLHYVFDRFFKWIKSDEYMYLYKDMLVRTGLFGKDYLCEKDLLEWKNKVWEKNNG